MRILLLTDGIDPFVLGGMQKHSTLLAKELHANGIELFVAHCVYPNLPVPTDADIAAVLPPGCASQCFVFPSSLPFPGHYILNSYRYSRTLYAAFEAQLSSFDLIYAQGFTGLAFVGKKHIPPVWVNLHGLEMFQPAFSFSEFLQKQLLRIPAKRLLRKADRLQSLGGKLTPLLSQLGVPSNKIVELGIGISAAWLREQEEITRPVSPVFVFVGRYEQRKGLPVLYKALQILGKTDSQSGHGLHPKVHFVGPIPHSLRVEGEHLYYHGEVRDPEKLRAIVQSADVFLLPSLSEGMPTVILEAMSSGLAVIASDTGAVNVMVDEKNGVLCKPGDAQSLAVAIQNMYAWGPDTLYEMKRNSRQKVMQFLWEKVGKAHVAAFAAIKVSK